MSGKKNDHGKLRIDLIPVRPLLEVAKAYTLGAAKYSDRNWEQGVLYSRTFSAMMRHAWGWWNGETHDAKDGQHHLAAMVFCAMALMQYEQQATEDPNWEFDDRPDRAAVDDLLGTKEVLDEG